MASLHVKASNPNPGDSLRKALVTATDDNEKAKIYLSLAQLLKNRSADSSLLFLDRALEISRQQGSPETIGKIYLERGDIYSLQNNPDEAIRQFKIADSIFRKIEDKKLQVQALIQIGIAYSNNYTIGKSVSESCRYYLKALSIARETNDTSNLVALYNNLGTLYTKAKDFPVANDYYKKAQVIWEQLNDSVKMAIVYLNLGSININSGKYDTARSYFEKAIPIFRAKNIEHWYLASLAGYGYSLLKEQRYAEAMTYADQALKYFMTSGIQENSPLSNVVLGDIFYIMGQVYYERGSYGLAKKYFLRVYHLLDSLDVYSRIRGVAERSR
jgi:tetratricopeptide (TPR) repeat protein